MLIFVFIIIVLFVNFFDNEKNKNPYRNTYIYGFDKKESKHQSHKRTKIKKIQYKKRFLMGIKKITKQILKISMQNFPRWNSCVCCKVWNLNFVKYSLVSSVDFARIYFIRVLLKFQFIIYNRLCDRVLIIHMM